MGAFSAGTRRFMMTLRKAAGKKLRIAAGKTPPLIKTPECRTKSASSGAELTEKLKTDAGLPKRLLRELKSAPGNELSYEELSQRLSQEGKE